MSEYPFTVHAPLPDGYDPTDYSSLQLYMKHLVALLKRYTLIHTSHPDRFFEIVTQKRFSRLPEALETQLLGQPDVLQSAVEEISHLCGAFEHEFVVRGDRLKHFQVGEVFPHGSLTYEELPHLICNGPQHDPALKAFFDATQALKLKRRHAEFPNPVATLYPDVNHREASQDSPNAFALTGEERLCVRSALLGKGMCTKKKHEVAIMDDTMRAVLRETSKVMGTDKITVMNVGEGKGYVSRVLSICEGTPVVGIDCNPLHKEVALQRLEPILDISSATGTQSKRILNLNYIPRGKTTCVTCRVSTETDWVGVLRGCVPLSDDCGNVVSCPHKITADGLDHDEASSDKRTATITCGTTAVDSFLSKVSCKICHKVFRSHNGSVLVKHARQHVERIKYKQSLGSDDVPLNEHEILFCTKLPLWTSSLSPEQLSQKVTMDLFEPFADGVMETTKRLRSATDCEYLEENTEISQFPRAVDVLVKQIPNEIPNVVETDAVDLSASQNKIEADSDVVYQRMTIVGYDDGANRYKVLVHNGTPPATPRNGIVGGKNKMVSLEKDKVISVLPLEPIAPIVHPVAAPSLSNVSLMGLHTCGDLGSAICRLYRDTCAPSMVLVSCCWHALTDKGFPLSNTLRNDLQFTTNSLSLMLATQPLESFINSSSDEHFGSSRLLFYRSLFAVVWEDLRVKCSPDQTTIIDSYEFAKCRPILDRSFLRALAKDKHTLTFTDFCLRVRDCCMNEEFIVKTSKALLNGRSAAESSSFGDDDKSTLESSKKRLCLYIGIGDSTNSRYMETAKECEAHYFEKYYASFVGFTTLRTWMCHLLEALLLVDRLIFLCETSMERKHSAGKEHLSLVPLFDGTLSPRLFGIIGLKGGPQTETH